MGLLTRLFRRRPVVPSDPHKFAQDYWRNCADSFLAGDDYYEAVEACLRNDIFPLVASDSRILDVGCGNGRFTFMFAEVCPQGHVTGLDLAPDLVEKAQTRAREAGINNISFALKDCLEPGAFGGTFDWVLCMGVAATIFDETAFVELMDGLCERVGDNGYLLMRESMTLSGEPMSYVQPHYCACYRPLEVLESHTARHSLRLIAQHPLKTWEDEGTINKFLLFQRMV